MGRHLELDGAPANNKVHRQIKMKQAKHKSQEVQRHFLQQQQQQQRVHQVQRPQQQQQQEVHQEVHQQQQEQEVHQQQRVHQVQRPQQQQQQQQEVHQEVHQQQQQQPPPLLMGGHPFGGPLGGSTAGYEVPRRLPDPPGASEPPAHLPRCSSLPPFEPSEHLSHFQEFLDSNWAAKGASPTARSATEYLAYLYPYVACVPPAPPASVSRPEPVRYSCSGAFWAGPRPKPLKVVSFVPIGYELDILEVRLHEHEDVVDLTVLSESVYTHRVQRKPLFYERSKERFSRFQGSILHVIDDEAALFRERDLESKTGDDWRNDIRKLEYPWLRFLEASGLEGPSDPRLSEFLLVASDMDELPSAEQIAHFKHCSPANPTRHYRLGAVFYSHNFRWHLPQNSPEFSTTVTEGASVLGEKRLPYRPPRNLVSDYSEHKGWVLNRFFGPYVDMFKELALAEGGCIPQSRDRSLAYDPTLAEEWRSKGIRTCCRSDGNLVRPPPTGHGVPWYARLNKERFPYMFPAS